MKVFWKRVDVTEGGEGCEITLDGRPVRTPGRAPLLLPNRALADVVAEEWRAQTETVDPLSMPATRLANSAIEKVTPDIGAVADYIAGYAETDLLCYRASEPAGLVDQQRAAWDPLLDWAEARYSARLLVTEGVMPVTQPPEALAALRAGLDGLDPFTIAALHELVALSSSLIIGCAVLEKPDNAPILWKHSRIDESWNIEEWGEDEQEAQMTLRKEQSFLMAANIVDCLKS